jgi:hypothetical protein
MHPFAVTMSFGYQAAVVAVLILIARVTPHAPLFMPVFFIISHLAFRP